MLNSLRSYSTPAAAGEWGGGAVAPSPRACGPPPPSPAGPGLRSGLPRRGRRSRRGAVVFGSLPGCVVGGACCALRGGAVAPAPARAAPARPSRRRRSRLGPVVRPGRPSPRALWAVRPRAPPWVAALRGGRGSGRPGLCRSGRGVVGSPPGPAWAVRPGRPAWVTVRRPPACARFGAVLFGGLLFGSRRGLRRAARGLFRGCPLTGRDSERRNSGPVLPRWVPGAGRCLGWVCASPVGQQDRAMMVIAAEWLRSVPSQLRCRSFFPGQISRRSTKFSRPV